MTTMTDRIISAILAANSVLVCGHIRPDGDCIGSALAVRRLCQNLGKPADAVCDADSPKLYSFLPDHELFCDARQKSYDLFIAVDCATENRLGKYSEYLKRAENSINIDHHPTNPGYGKINHIVPSACSTCAILYDLLGQAGYIDNDMAQMLYTGLSTDTGHFMHSNTDSHAFVIASELCKYGIDIGELNREIYKKNFNRIKLTARAIDGIVLFEQGRIALMNISLDDMNKCGCTTEDTEGLIDFASSIAGVQISVSMCEQPGSVYRVSFRSRKANVAEAAATFGGGGHALAAGCIITGNRYDVMEKVLAAARTALNK